MIEYWKRASRGRRWLIVSTVLLVIAAVSGCKSVGFYSQALKGQYQILSSQIRVERLLEDKTTPEELRAKLKLVGDLRRFAEQELALKVDGHYTRYANLHRPFVVWNIQAAGEFSMQPKTWWYPVLGRLEYRGYFTEAGATNYARWLRGRGFDVHVGGVSAYSTLGWFRDPLLNTFISDPEPDLAETIFHELSHQRVFIGGDTDFNEAFATTVGQEATRRWLAAKGDAAALREYDQQLARNDQFVQLVAATRTQLEALFGDTRDEDGKIRAARPGPAAPAEELRREKERIIAQFRAGYARLREGWGGEAFRENWMKSNINNAKLNSIANYYDLVPGFQALLSLKGGDLAAFYDAVEELGRKSRKERHEWLRLLAQKGSTPPAESLTHLPPLASRPSLALCSHKTF
jgi:predicted aminopeptidase